MTSQDENSSTKWVSYIGYSLQRIKAESFHEKQLVLFQIHPVLIIDDRKRKLGIPVKIGIPTLGYVHLPTCECKKYSCFVCSLENL